MTTKKPRKKKAVYTSAILDHGLDVDKQLWVSSVEAKKKAKFLGVLPINGGDVRTYLFWQDTKHPRGSHYFGVYLAYDGETYIFDAQRVSKTTFNGVLQPNGLVMYSRNQHDYRVNKWNDMVDGGGEYYRYGIGNKSKSKPVEFKVVKDRVVLVD